MGEKQEVTALNTELEPHTIRFSDNQGDEWIFKVDLLDGTVETKGKNAQKKAAKIFYESLQIEGQTLYQKIAELETKLSILTDVAKEAAEETGNRELSIVLEQIRELKSSNADDV